MATTTLVQPKMAPATNALAIGLAVFIFLTLAAGLIWVMAQPVVPTGGLERTPAAVPVPVPPAASQPTGSAAPARSLPAEQPQPAPVPVPTAPVPQGTPAPVRVGVLAGQAPAFDAPGQAAAGSSRLAWSPNRAARFNFGWLLGSAAFMGVALMVLAAQKTRVARVAGA